MARPTEREAGPLDSTGNDTVVPHQPVRPSPAPPTARPAHQRLLIGAGALFLAAATLLVACRAVGADAVTPVPQLLAFLPWLLAPAAAALLLTALLRWRAGVVWALVLLAATGWFVRPYDAGAFGPRGPALARVEVLTSNVEFGQATLGLIGAIRRERPDLVFVQECEFVCARLLDTRIPRSAYPYRHVVEASGAEGSAIYSVFPLTDTDGIDGTLAMPGSEARIGGRTVGLQLAHPLPPVPGGVDDWREELGRVRAYAAGHREGPVILAGDFNATRDHAAFRDVLDAGGLLDSAALGGAGRTPSWPSAAPRPLGAQIDHVLVSDDFSVRDARFLDLADTDHRSLLVSLELHGEAGAK
ncbi:endonuclease/exonuclease/phosphatase family protein [Streptomyces liangshanensis]|uniref:Endonuclease/exonuclease/phosphatase family protein n=1 Tax=Streptomyces liangshanensis TaxID=2717324 RepID=A0A6G9H0I2_9ACTN|nr:endonuclease/exonuclease/phosphatase family protein [Streptomyces liangshanensis]QIQ03721.1 endonuclease/exonuclease/phosphatase family protein [Streptomyces liangshanensis]